jgi:hypothetical protein
MSKVVTKAIKQASLNLKDMADKSRVDITEEDVTEILTGITLDRSTSNRGLSYVWGKETEKPYALEGLIEQIKSIFNVGKEVEGWAISYYAPPQKNERGQPTTNELRIPPIEKGLGGRFIVVVGTKEVPTLEVAVGSTGAENQYFMMPGDCRYLKITICPVLNVIFSNKYSEKLAPRKGFREMTIKKNLFNRHVFVIDAHVSVGALADKVKKELIGISSEEVAEKLMKQSDIVAKLASKSTSETSSGSVVVPEIDTTKN